MCEKREHVLDYLYDECDPAARRGVEAHLAECGSCRDELQGWRSVRTDLLAWGVPEQPSVWTPFAPPRVLPWYKQVPVWAMAAAATLVFAIGAAGGFVARAASATLLAQPSTQTVAAAPALSEQQVRTLARAEAQAIAVNVMQPIASHQVDEATLVRRANDLIAQSEARLSQRQGVQIRQFYQDADRQRDLNQDAMRKLFADNTASMRTELYTEMRAQLRALQQSQADKQQKEK
jgi:anti-sigma factor RsiW